MADPWADLDPGVPLLLVPVRIETQSQQTPDGLVLRVRISPDDLSVDPVTGATHLLPERFRVRVVQGGVVTAEQEGAPVDLASVGVALGAAGDDAAFEAGATALRALADGDPSGPAWLRDYAGAEAAGLAITVPLPSDDRIDLLTVTGARSGGADAGASAVRDALAAHPGLSLVAAGTPTNNTERARADDAPPALSTAGPRLLSHAFGIPDPGGLAGMSGTILDPDLPGAASDALWPVTWEPWLAATWRTRALGPYETAELQQYIAAHVRPAGPLPAVRIGAQPYGILPVVTAADYRPDDAAEALVAAAVRHAAPIWSAAAAPPTVMTGDLRDTLPQILGLAPTSRNVRIRQILHPGGVVLAGAEERASVAREIERAADLPPGALRGLPDLGTPRVLGLPLVADDDPDVLRLLAEQAPSTADASVLQVLLSAARARSLATVRAARRRLLELTDFVNEAHERVLDGPPGDAQDRLRQDIVQRVPILVEAVHPDAAGAVADILFPELFDLDIATRDPIAADALARLREHLPWITRAGRLAPRITGRGLFGPGPRSAAREILAALVAYLAALEVVRRARLGIARLADAEDADIRAAVFAGALDVCSHRFDAWATALASGRLARLRRDAPTGISIGAYAWVEDITLTPRAAGDDPQEAGGVGWVQAPSPRHAAAAAVLRSARLTHAPADGPDDPLDLDVSSTRTREATAIVRGMRAGQELAALLGYRFERWLHETDPSLNRFVPALRALAPLTVGRETPTVTAEPSLVLTGSVVDGRVLPQKAAELGAQLTDPARLGGVRVADDVEIATVSTLVARLAQVADAVADLLLAEGVQQLVTGDRARAAAAMDALSGELLPEEPEIPVAAGERAGATARVAILGGAEAAGAADGWQAGIRAAAHPFLEAWCRSVLGRADRIVVARTAGGQNRLLAPFGLSALDLVVAADGTPEGLGRLWARLRRRRPTLPLAPFLGRPTGTGRISLGEAWQLASAARAVLGGARGAEPDDLVAAGARSELARHTLDTAALTARLDAVLDGLDAVVAALPDPASATVPRLRVAADALAAIGVGDTTDPDVLVPADGDADGADSALRAFVADGAATLDRRRARARTLADDGRTAEALADLLGPLPVVQRLVPPPTGAAIVHARVPAAASAGIRRWVARMGTVRPPVGRWTTLAAIRRATGRAGELAAAVFVPPPHPPAWFGDALPPDGVATSIVYESLPGFAASGAIAGLILDDWAEHRPALRTVSSPEEETPSRQESLVETGLALHANAPAARAPQALLLAVSPDDGGWSETRIDAVLAEVRGLLRMRLATPADLPLVGDVLPAIALDHWSAFDEPTIDPRALRALAVDVPTFARSEP
ncbi:hypothetical protein [Microbacterium sp. bgisy189]|uniref:hypothetical protein n=1 Tax=Microbacterium sp. bgisy189 TaxID=3413798 RepID=UPI003EBADA04